MISFRICFQTYLFDLTFFIFFILWRTGKQAILDSCKFLPRIVGTLCSSPIRKFIFSIKECFLLFGYFLAALKNGNIKNHLITSKKINLFNWSPINRSDYRKQNGRYVSKKNAPKRSVNSFFYSIYKKKGLLSNNQFYKDIHSQTTMYVYKRMPWRLLSRLWGYLNSLELPIWLREPIYHLYVWMFDCNLQETITQDLRRYKNLSEFFRRLLKPELRPIHQKASLTSPVDGTILHCGRVEHNLLEQVKGVTYSLQEFLGPFEASRFQSEMKECWEKEEEGSDDSGMNSGRDVNDDADLDSVPLEKNKDEEEEEEDDKKAINLNFSGSEDGDGEEEMVEKNYDASDAERIISEVDVSERSLGERVRVHQDRLPSKCYSMTTIQAEYTSNPSASHSSFPLLDMETSHLLEDPANNGLFYCVIYLAPGDYHRFHSPADWSVQYRRHFPGELFSVKPSVAHWLKGLFNMNERVVYLGRWMHGFFSMTAVGATNVGSISVYIDKKLKTNTRQKINQGRFFDKSFVEGDRQKLQRMMPGDFGQVGNGDMRKDAGVYMKKGKLFGEFNLGSTIVLLFEAPKNLKFSAEPGHKVKYGQPLVSI